MKYGTIRIRTLIAAFRGLHPFRVKKNPDFESEEDVMSKYGHLSVNWFEDLVNRMGGEERAEAFKRGQLKLVPVEQLPTLTLTLTLIQTITVPAVVRFSARTFTKKPTVKIGWMGENFKKHFLGKVETDSPSTEITTSRLGRDSLDAPILAELGERAETSLAHLWHLLSRQPKGEPGVFLTNGYANIFYIKDARGTLWAVGACWFVSDGCWYVGAHSVSRPDGWLVGSLVFSRK